MEKVKLPREVAEAIENLRLLGYTDYQIAWNVCGGIEPHEEFKRINHEDGDMILRALYIGYEVEQTPDDELREMFNDALKQEKTLTPNSARHQFWNGRRMAIIDTLNTLNIKIEGVNA